MERGQELVLLAKERRIYVGKIGKQSKTQSKSILICILTPLRQ